MKKYLPYLSLSILSILVLSGCGSSSGETLPELGLVTGKITLDGQPLPEAMVTFQPSSGGAMSSGATDESGIYEIFFNTETPGAVIGTHKISISKPDGEAGPDLVPMKYNFQTTLTADVAAGENVHDFKLTSK